MEETPEQRRLVERARGRQQFKHNDRVIYEWDQDLNEVNIYINPPPGVRQKDLDIKIEPRRLSVGLRGNPPFLQEEFQGLVKTSESFWMIEDGELHINLQKSAKGETWLAALKGHQALDSFTQSEVQKKLMLERFQEEHPGFDFSGASFSGQAPDPRSFMGGVSYK
eukprot:GILK01003320.1.p1 GENE.GILK01003320.1~~GILK01003320.1.p1  ORF type:complete len:183 (+),score=22.84 GILK01003320.1:52-549(+)